MLTNASYTQGWDTVSESKLQVELHTVENTANQIQHQKFRKILFGLYFFMVLRQAR